MEKEYYRDYYTLERNHWWFRARKNILEAQVQRLFPNRTNLKILNAGCATGYSSEWLMQFGEVSSLEYDAECFAFTRDVVKIPIVQGSITELPFEDNQFDLIVAFDVVEHVENDVLAVQEMQRVAKPGGIIFISVPAFNFLWSNHDEVNHHFRRYKIATLSNTFRKSTLKHLYTSYFNTFLFIPITAYRLIGNLIQKIKHGGNQKIYNENSNDLTVGKDNLASKIFFRIFNAENILLRKGFNFPFGISIMAAYKK